MIYIVEILYKELESVMIIHLINEIDNQNKPILKIMIIIIFKISQITSSDNLYRNMTSSRSKTTG